MNTATTPHKALIIDCSGGITCSFYIKNLRVSYDIYIDTDYENGDTNFGGNNLTFRIMQFLQIFDVSYVIFHNMYDALLEAYQKLHAKGGKPQCKLF